MGAYVTSTEIPIILHFVELEVLTVRKAVESWMKQRKILTLTMDDFEDGASAEAFAAIEGLAINFGAVTVVWVRPELDDGDDEDVSVIDLEVTNIGDWL